MTDSLPGAKRVAIACGGTGGHLFPGLAIADELARQNCAVTLLVSPKEIDQTAVKEATGFDIVTLPAVGLVHGQVLRFLRGFRASYVRARAEFRARPPNAVLAMGGFTSAPPVLAGKFARARTFLHEANTIPGRANRWLSWIVDLAFVGFASAAERLHSRHIKVTGTPVRRQFKPLDPAVCRSKLGFDPGRPVVLVMGGSQGASGINELIMRALPVIKKRAPDWQWLHLAGAADLAPLQRAYRETSFDAIVKPFCSQMEIALGAATAAVSRAGASSLAELAEMELPSVLLPYPAATDNHQFFNALAFQQTGAGVLLEQAAAAPDALASLLLPLVTDASARGTMRQALNGWRKPEAAWEIAQAVLTTLSEPGCLDNPFARKPAAIGTEIKHPGAFSQGTERRADAVFQKLSPEASHD